MALIVDGRVPQAHHYNNLDNLGKCPDVNGESVFLTTCCNYFSGKNQEIPEPRIRNYEV